MSDTVVIGLGNPLAGDDGAGWYAAEALRAHPELPATVDIVQGGTDLLRFRHLLAPGHRVFIVDAVLDPGPPGRLLVIHDLDAIEQRPGWVHALCPAHALRLLRAIDPDIAATPVTFLLITIQAVRIDPALSPELADRVPALVDELLAAVRGRHVGEAPTRDVP